MTTQTKASDPVREAFERWASDDGEYPAAVERAGHGYQLAQTQSYWMAWQAAYAQARADLIAEIHERITDRAVAGALLAKDVRNIIPKE